MLEDRNAEYGEVTTTPVVNSRAKKNKETSLGPVTKTPLQKAEAAYKGKGKSIDLYASQAAKAGAAVTQNTLPDEHDEDLLNFSGVVRKKSKESKKS